MTALIVCAVLSIAAFAALCIACCMSAKEDPCKGCDREYCTECEYWREMTENATD